MTRLLALVLGTTISALGTASYAAAQSPDSLASDLPTQQSSTLAERPYSSPESREPCDTFNPLRQPHFGDFHVHTAWSFDANTQDTRNKPADAYRFAKGAPMGIQPYDENDQAQRTVQLDRPLDFTAVTDHAIVASPASSATNGQPAPAAAKTCTTT